MRSLSLILVAGLLPALATPSMAQETAAPSTATPPQTQAEKNALLDLVLTNVKKSDETMNFYERGERLEVRKNAADSLGPADVKVSRVIPAGTGVDHIPIG